jgi:hypothetical protein
VRLFFKFRPYYLLGTHNFENIPKLLDDILEEYYLIGRASHIVTVNESKFRKSL